MTQDNSKKSKIAMKDKLLNASLPHVVNEGWNMKSFRLGASDSGFKTVEVLRIFPGGCSDAAAHFSQFLDQKMLNSLLHADLSSMRVRDRIIICVKARIEAAAESPIAFRRLKSYLSLPGNTILATKLAWQTCDEIWHAAGDKATDFNYYTKRALLFPVLTSTTLYWFDDNSENYSETWAYLERRISDVLKIPSYSRNATKVFSKIKDYFGRVGSRCSLR